MNEIAINGRFLTRKMTGVDRFAMEIVSEIDRSLMASDQFVAGMRFRIMVPSGTQVALRLNAIPIEIVGKRAGQGWEQFDFPVAAQSHLLLNLCNTAPVWHPRQVVVIHDAATVAYPTTFSRGFRSWYRILMPILGRIARRVVTVSEFSRTEIIKAFAIPEGKISVCVEGGEHILRIPADATALTRFGLGVRPFVLAVSSMAAHKNFRLVLEALQHMPDAPFDVAIAGGANSKVFGDAGHVESDRIKWLGYVSDAELRALYESAMCFVFPSIYEGFGIPPLEAMHCGCPVLAAEAASIPEVCGDAALYFDPHDAVQLATLLERVSTDGELRKELAERGRERADRFSWQQAAREVVAACREAML